MAGVGIELHEIAMLPSERIKHAAAERIRRNVDRLVDAGSVSDAKIVESSHGVSVSVVPVHKHTLILLSDLLQK